MAQRIIIPRLGQTMTEGLIARWYKSDGAHVEADDDVYELEYDKASAPVKAKKEGTLRHLFAEGTSVAVGQAVGVVLEEGETLESVDTSSGHDVANSAQAGRRKPEDVAPGQAASIERQDADVIVIGGGPGGYVCALKLAALGKSVMLIERDQVGGTCLNRGCIPTKALLQSAELFANMKTTAPEMGVTAENVKLDTMQVNARKQKVVDTLVRGVQGLLKARKVKVLNGEAAFVSAHAVKVKLADGTRKEIEAPNIVVASGSRAAMPPIEGIEGTSILTSTEALDVSKLPQSMIVIGGGVIGMEMGSAYADFGVKVTVVEAMPSLLPGMDAEVVKEFTRHAMKKVDIYTSALVKRIADVEGGGKRVSFEQDGKQTEITADCVLVAVGRVPETEALDLDKAGVKTERGRVLVDEAYQTNVPGIYCIGDANAICMLAHVASAQGIGVAEKIAGHMCGITQDVVPSCVYTDPEIAAVGLTEEQAKEKGLDYKTAKFSFRANGRSLVLGKGEGFAKIVGGTKYNEILGVHIVGPYATELIAECALAMKLEGCVEDIANTIHAHPTVSESIMEAAESFLGGGIHSL